MKTFQELKAACTVQGQVRRCEIEGMILPYETVFAHMLSQGFLEMEEAIELFKLLGKSEDFAIQSIRNPWKV